MSGCLLFRFLLAVEAGDLRTDGIAGIHRCARLSFARAAVHGDPLVEEKLGAIGSHGWFADDFDGVAQLMADRSHQFAISLARVDQDEHEPVCPGTADADKARTHAVAVPS